MFYILLRHPGIFAYADRCPQTHCKMCPLLKFLVFRYVEREIFWKLLKLIMLKGLTHEKKKYIYFFFPLLESGICLWPFVIIAQWRSVCCADGMIGSVGKDRACRRMKVIEIIMVMTWEIVIIIMIIVMIVILLVMITFIAVVLVSYWERDVIRQGPVPG